MGDASLGQPRHRAPAPGLGPALSETRRGEEGRYRQSFGRAADRRRQDGEGGGLVNWLAADFIFYS